MKKKKKIILNMHTFFFKLSVFKIFRIFEIHSYLCNFQTFMHINVSNRIILIKTDSGMLIT